MRSTAPTDMREPSRRPHLGDVLFFQLTRALAIFVILLAIVFVVMLFERSSTAFRQLGFGFFTGTTWDVAHETYGSLPTMLGTIVTSFLSVLIAVPISILTSIFLALYAPSWLRNPLSYVVESLAAIPSVIIGLWGIFVLVPALRVVQVWLQNHFAWFPLFNGPAIRGFGVLASGVVLAIMITPIIAAIARDVIRTVPRVQMEGMLALGATRWEAIWKVVLPYARVGIIGAVLLGLGRALGETMAVAMVGGNSFTIPSSLFAPSYTMASQIAGQFGEAGSALNLSALFYVALVLFLLTVIVEVAAQLLIWRLTKGQTGPRLQG